MYKRYLSMPAAILRACEWLVGACRSSSTAEQLSRRCADVPRDRTRSKLGDLLLWRWPLQWCSAAAVRKLRREVAAPNATPSISATGLDQREASVRRREVNVEKREADVQQREVNLGG